MEYSNAIKNARIQVLTNLIDEKACYMRLYSGVKPVNPEFNLTDQVLLCELVFVAPCVINVTDGVATMRPLTEKLAIATGTVEFARIVNVDDEVLVDLSIGEITSDLEVGSATIYQGAMVRVDNWTLSD
jgi:ABC-type uncharacterized transport system permease subunit